MNKITLQYFLANLFILLINYFLVQKVIYIDNEAYQLYAINGSGIIILVSGFVFLGILISLKIKVRNTLFVYMFSTLIKNGVLIFFAFQHKTILKEMIFYFASIYLIIMFLEVLFILKLKEKLEGQLK